MDSIAMITKVLFFSVMNLTNKKCWIAMIFLWKVFF